LRGLEAVYKADAVEADTVKAARILRSWRGVEDREVVEEGIAAAPLLAISFI